MSALVFTKLWAPTTTAEVVIAAVHRGHEPSKIDCVFQYVNMMNNSFMSGFWEFLWLNYIFNKIECNLLLPVAITWPGSSKVMWLSKRKQGPSIRQGRMSSRNGEKLTPWCCLGWGTVCSPGCAREVFKPWQGTATSIWRAGDEKRFI